MYTDYPTIERAAIVIFFYFSKVHAHTGSVKVYLLGYIDLRKERTWQQSYISTKFISLHERESACARFPKFRRDLF